ncbi:MAG: hypothetical protein PHC75_03540 [Burkholderiales bacterium]|nr:hypothetical protein [Burkholderiales bacterium]
MKNLLALLSVLYASTSLAMSSVNLDISNYHCNGLKLTSQITVNTLTTHCKDAKVIMHEEPSGGMYANREPGGGDAMTMIAPNGDTDSILDQVKFHSDKGSYLVCYFNSNKLIKCKATPPTQGIINKPIASTIK